MKRLVEPPSSRIEAASVGAEISRRAPHHGGDSDVIKRLRLKATAVAAFSHVDRGFYLGAVTGAEQTLAIAFLVRDFPSKGLFEEAVGVTVVAEWNALRRGTVPERSFPYIQLKIALKALKSLSVTDIFYLQLLYISR